MLFVRQGQHFHMQILLLLQLILICEWCSLYFFPVNFIIILLQMSVKNNKISDWNRKLFFWALKIIRGSQVNVLLNQINDCELGLACAIKWFVITITPVIPRLYKIKANAQLCVLVLSVFCIVTSCNRLLGEERQCTVVLCLMFISAVSCEFWFSKAKMHWDCIFQEPPDDFWFRVMGEELSGLFEEVSHKRPADKDSDWLSLSNGFIFGSFLFDTLYYSVSSHIPVNKLVSPISVFFFPSSFPTPFSWGEGGVLHD